MFAYMFAELVILAVILDVMEYVIQNIQQMQLSSTRSNLDCFGLGEVFDILAEIGQVFAERSCPCR